MLIGRYYIIHASIEGFMRLNFHKTYTHIKGFNTLITWIKLASVLNESFRAVLPCSTVWVCGWTVDLAVQIEATEQYFPVVQFIMLYKVVLTLKPVDEILKCDLSNESYWAVLSCGAVYYAVQGGFKFEACGWNPKVWPFKWKLLSSTFLWCCLLCCTRWF